MEDKKYELLKDDYKEVFGIKSYRIRALKDFGDVKKGDVGGYIQNEENLSQKNTCWVYGEAEVWGEARVYGGAEIYGKVEVYGGAKVYGKARVRGKARVYGGAKVYGEARVYGGAEIYGKVEVYGKAEVYGGAEVYGEAEIKSLQDYIVFKNNWSSGRSFTWTRSNDMWNVGCFYGNGKELIKKAYKDSKLSGDMYKMYVELVEKIKERLKEEENDG